MTATALAPRLFQSRRLRRVGGGAVALLTLDTLVGLILSGLAAAIQAG